jgi:hypothetical protein
MENAILRKWTGYKDEIMKSSPGTEEHDKLASLVAAVLTLADEVRQTRPSGTGGRP